MAYDSGFSQPNANDERGWLWVVTILSLIYSASLFGARIFVKYGMLWWDDALLGAGYILAIARWATIMTGFSMGLGADSLIVGISTSTENTLAELAFSSRTLFLVAHWMAKVSTLLFTRKIFSGNMSHETLIFGVSFLVVVGSGVVAVVTSSAACDPTGYIYGRRDALCAANDVRWIVVCIMDIVSEICLVAVPVLLLVPSKMHVSKKRRVYQLYSFRLGVAAFSIAQTVTYIRFLYGGRTSIGLTKTLVLQELLLCYSFVSATIPCFRSFMGAFASPMLMLNPNTTLGGSYGNQNSGNAYPLQSFGKGSKDGGKARYFPGRNGRNDSESRRVNAGLRPDQAEYNVGVAYRGRTSENSDGSEQMIIRRDVEIHVARDSERSLPESMERGPR